MNKHIAIVMIKYIFSIIIGILIGIIGCLYFNSTNIKIPDTKYISYKTYESLFPKPEIFSVPDYRFIVNEIIETRLDTVFVPINRQESYRLFYGDISFDNNNISLGFWNPTLLRFEVDTFKIPQKKWGIVPSVSMVYGSDFILRGNFAVRYNNFHIGIESGYIHGYGNYWGIVSYIRF